MKKITLLLFALFAFSFSNQVNAQCTTYTGGGPWTDFNSTFGGAPCDAGTGSPINEINTFQVYADESYLMDDIISGYTYTFSICNGPDAGSWVPSFTIIAPSGAIDAFGTDTGSSCAITWTATEAGTYTIGISEAGVACDSSTNRSTNNGFPAITGTDGENCLGCTATAAPNAVISPDPADGATGVPVFEGTAGDGSVGTGVNFSWLEDATGEPAESFNISLGLTPSGDDIGTLPDFNSGGGVLFGATPNTTYYWKIEAVNCVGSTSGPVWSFTTGEILSVEESTLETFSVYPNPTSNVLNIKSTQDVDSVTVFNLLGQNVASFTKNEITNSSIDLSELSNGLYLVKITSGDKTQTLRVTKE